MTRVWKWDPHVERFVFEKIMIFEKKIRFFSEKLILNKIDEIERNWMIRTTRSLELFDKKSLPC